MILCLRDADATAQLGAALSRALGPVSACPAEGVRLHLRGPLGAGKTSLARGLLRAMGVTGHVRSPSYTLIETYEAQGWQIVHYDLYRLGGGEELELLGAREHLAAGHLCCIEWPERAGGWLPAAHLEVDLGYEHGGRKARIQAHATFGRRWLERLAIPDTLK